MMHLELRSSMFAETCISKSMPEFEVGHKKTSFFVRGVVKNGICEDCVFEVKQLFGIVF